MSALTQLKKFMGMDDDDLYDDEYDDEEEDENVIPLDTERFRRTGRKPVTTAYPRDNKTVKILKPKSFEETREIAEDLRRGIICLVNTTALEKKEAQRLLDFLCGAAFSLDGVVQEVETSVFVISPNDITVNSHLEESKVKAKSGSFINWNIKE